MHRLLNGLVVFLCRGGNMQSIQVALQPRCADSCTVRLTAESIVYYALSFVMKRRVSLH